MKLENFQYIDRLGAWAVVAFMLVAGAMAFDTARCLAFKSAHRNDSSPASPPARMPATNGLTQAITNVVETPLPASPPAPAPAPAQPEKLKKPVPIPNPREIGESHPPGAGGA